MGDTRDRRAESESGRTGRLAVFAVVLLAAVAAAAQTPPSEAPAAAPAQRSFATPEEAGAALVEALGQDEVPALVALLGAAAEPVLNAGDPAEERVERQELHRAGKELLSVRRETDDSAVLVLGQKAWPFPFPLVKAGESWRFDTEAGLEETAARRIGAHELAAIELARETVEAQEEYAEVDRDGDEVLEYAQRILSTTGQKDGLYWPDPQDPSPFGEFVARAERYTVGKQVGDPYRGYFFKVLKRQGAHPPGGRYDYVINGNMIGGFALLAWPAEYGETGVMTFAVSHQGKVFQKDLGPETARLATALAEYDPDETWSEVTD
jgi:hypothetical protein